MLLYAKFVMSEFNDMQVTEVGEQKVTHYVKCHAPPSVLYEHAEQRFVKMPLQVCTTASLVLIRSFDHCFLFSKLILYT